MSWLGNGFSRESMKSLADAFQEVQEGAGKTYVPGAKIGGTIKKPNGKTVKVEDVETEEELIEDEYCVSVEDGLALEEGKKKCKDGYKWDSEKGKCVKKKKKSSSKTTVIVKTGGRGGYYGGLYPGYGSGGGSNNGDGGEGETESGGGDGGGDGGGGGE
jgi:uncharacterized membrane protein YgcG